MNPKLISKISSIPQWKDNNGKALIDAVNKIPGIYVRDLKYSDLILPSTQCNGVYLFQQGDHFILKEQTGKQDVQYSSTPIYWYIGKATSRALVDRIGAHFSPRHDDYMNILLRNIAWLLSGCTTNKDFINTPELTNQQKDTFLEKALDIIQDLKLKVVVFDVPNACNSQKHIKEEIAYAEKLLQSAFHPLLNNVNRTPRALIRNF